jgi:hypothetical protein
MDPPSSDILIEPSEKWKIILEDWKMAKDRIDSFDKSVLQIRIQGIPIVLVFIAIGFAVINITKQFQIPFINCNGAALPFIFAALFIPPLAVLDYVHYKMLLKAVSYAKKIEESGSFKGLLGITNAISDRKMGNIHTICAISMYILIFILCILIIAAVWHGIDVETSSIPIIL